jgi:hypothetical protein
VKKIYLSRLFILGWLSFSMQSHAQSMQDGEPNSRKNSWNIGIENDLLVGSKKDADYTGGFFFSLLGPAAARSPFSLDPILGVFDGSWLDPKASNREHGLQVSMQAWVPEDTSASTPIYNDRPYASLLALKSTRVYIGDYADPVWASSLSVGLLGAGFAKNIHDQFHQLVGSGEGPKGYANQISNGGEPTLLYNVRRQSLITEMKSGGIRHDLKWSGEGSLGYLTEAKLAVSGRSGHMSNAWWSMQTERAGFYAPHHKSGDLYFSYGVAVMFRAYNALLQGQFRDSNVTMKGSDLEAVIGEVWTGLTYAVSDSVTLNYKINFQTSEIKSGIGARNFGSGGVFLAYRY